MFRPEYISMRQYGISILPSLCSLLCILPLQAQDAPDDNGAADDNGLLGAGFGDMPEMPESIRVTNDGTLEFDSKLGTFLFKGSIVVQGDNGLVLRAGRVLVNSKSETANLAGHVSVRQKSTKGKNGKIIPGIQLFANKVLLNAKTKIIILDGDVSIYQGPTLHLTLIHI